MGDRVSDKKLSDLVLEDTKPRPVPEMRAYNPTLRERMASGLQEGLEGLGVSRYTARKNAQTLTGGPSSNLPIDLGFADFVPFLGTTMGLEEGARDLGHAADAVGRGDYIDAAANAAGAAAGLIPGGYSTYKTGKGMLKKIRSMELPTIKPIETDSVPKVKKQSLREWAMAGGGVPTSHKGREHVWHGKAEKFAAGGGVFNTVPDMADGDDIIQGPAYAGGGAVKKIVKGAVEGVVEGIKPMVDRLSMNFKDVTKRVPELQEGAQKVQLGDMTRAQYEKLVNKNKPVKPYEFIPKPATRDEAVNALTADKRDLYGTPSGMLQAGDPVGLRLDIPAYSDHGVWVPAVHRQAAGFGAGDRVGYESVAGVMNPTFGMSEKAALSIAAGKPKGTIATIKGEWNPMDEQKAIARAQEYLDHPEWAQVGMDPERHGYFYDRRTMQPITAAEEAIQIGPLVLAKNPQYGKKKDFKYAVGGGVKKAVKEAVTGMVEGIQKILPSAERDANKAKFLEPSVEKGRMYHATSADIKAFRDNARRPTFVTPKVEFANSFIGENARVGGGENIMPVRVQVRNPFDYENPKHMSDLTDRVNRRSPWLMNEVEAMGDFEHNWPAMEHPDIQRFIRDAGHDAFYAAEHGTKNLGIYDPKRIKSDISNKGAYDINKIDVNEAHGGAVHAAGGGAMKKMIKGALTSMSEGTQKVLPAAEREANLQKFLEPSKAQMRLYHGTTASENQKGDEAIRRLKPSKEGALGSGAYLTPKPNFAGSYAEKPGGNVLPVHAQIKNPLIIEGKGDPMIEALTKLGMPEEKAARMVERAYDQKGYVGKEVQSRAQAQGYDGLMQYRDGDLNEVVAYQPGAVKSAIGNEGTYDTMQLDLNRAMGGDVHMAKGGKAKDIVKAGLKKLFGDAPAGVEPIVVRTPEERSVIEKFGQKQDQEAVRQKKVAKAERSAKEDAGKAPEELTKPVKSAGKREAVTPDYYRKMANDLGDDAVLRAARAGKHLKPTGKGYIGAPRTVTSPQGLGAMRRDMDEDFSDAVEAVRLADPTRLGTWYDRAKQGIAESVEPFQLPRTLEQHGVYSAGVSPESELGFALKHLNSRVAGDPQMAYRGAPMRTLDEAVAENRPAKMGFKIGEYAEKNDPRVPNTGLFGVNDFRRAQGMGYTDPQGNPWKAGVSDTMHPFMDAETALQVDRANTAGTGGRTDWAGPQIQEVPWVYGKGQDQYSRGSSKGARYGGDELEGIKMSLRDANNTARDYMYKHAASATHEQVPGASLGHVPQVLSMTPEQKLAYGREGRFDLPSPEMELNEFPQVGAGNRDAIYSALGYRQLPSREAQGLYTNSLGQVETNPMTIARPLMDFPTGGGGGRMSPDTSKVMDTAEQFRALMDAQEAGAYNLPNTMDSVQGKNAMVLDTRNLNPNPLLDPSAGVTPTAEQLSEINRILGGASESAGADAEKLRSQMPYGPPTKSVSRKLGALDDAAGGYGVTSTNRGALVFPYNSQGGSGGLNEIIKRGGQELETVMPNAQRQKGVASTGYVPGVGKRGEYGPLPTAPYSGEATSDMLQAFAGLNPNVAQNLSESESVRAAIRAKALRDSKLGGARGDIQETRRFFSEADWPKAVAMMRKGMSPAAALAALGYNIKAMAADER